MNVLLAGVLSGDGEQICTIVEERGDMFPGKGRAVFIRAFLAPTRDLCANDDGTEVRPKAHGLSR